MKKRLLCVAALIVAVISFALAGCTDEKDPLVIKDTDNYVVIRADSEQLKIDGNTTLLDYMNALKEKNELDFEISGGMVVSVDGVANASDFSSCWMLYTSDEGNSNSAWGTALYKEKEYGSATLGCEQLKVKDGELYIWYYQSF